MVRGAREASPMEQQVQSFFPIFVYLAVIVGFALTTLALTHLPFIKPWKDTTVKSMPYESGMDPVEDARQHFDVKFYLIAILFLIFDVELLFLYPWDWFIATSSRRISCSIAAVENPT